MEPIIQQRGGDLDNFLQESKRLPETSFVSTSENALETLNRFEDMSADAVKLAEQMYKFISDQNPR